MEIDGDPKTDSVYLSCSKGDELSQSLESYLIQCFGIVAIYEICKFYHDLVGRTSTISSPHLLLSPALNHFIPSNPIN